MKRILMLLLVGVLTAATFVNDADAKRFGGGGNIGRQRSYSYTPRQAQPSPYRPQAPAAAPAAPRPPVAAPQPSGFRKWLGPLAGFAAGGLLASLFLGHGMGGGLLGFLLLAAGVWLLLSLLRSLFGGRRQPEPAAYAASVDDAASQPAPSGAWGQGVPAAGPALPAWFDEATFLRQAKSVFIRLQAAFDAKDLNDIRDFTTPEMFAEISMQVQEMGAQTQRTEVQQVEAELVDFAQEGDLVFASVRYFGLIKEEPFQPAQPFNEVWHVQKPAAQPHAPWHIAGIQQVN